MVIRTLILSLILVSCGREVDLKANKLESTQQITNAEVKQFQKAGIFVKNSNTFVVNSTSYKVSIYSSKNALDFIAATPSGSQVPVLVIGGYSANEVVIESIVRQ
jgi:hypothetical protein